MASKTYLIQASADAGYFLFPHQRLAQDSLGLPPYCFTNGHPGSEPEPWDVLSRNPERFSNSDRVIMFQAGKPAWLRGIWGFGSIERYGDEVRVRAGHMVATPLVISERVRRTLQAPVLRTLLGVNPHGSSYQGTFAEIPSPDYELLRALLEERDSGQLAPVVRQRSQHSSPAPNAKQAFEDWAGRRGFSLLSGGYPDILAQAPNGRVTCFEAKDRKDILSEAQRAMFNLLRTNGIEVVILNNVPNQDVERVVRESGWSIIAKGLRITVGWPDYFLVKEGKVVACELKTGHREEVTDNQLSTLAALSLLKGIETHVIRALPDETGQSWTLYDDTERWLRYPP